MGFLKMEKWRVVWEMSVVRWKVNITANVRQTRNIFRGDIQTDRHWNRDYDASTLYILMPPVPVSAMMFSDLMEKNTVKVI